MTTDQKSLRADSERVTAEFAALQDENVRLTEELNKSYEDLYIFSTVTPHMQSLHFSEARMRDLLQEFINAIRVEVAALLFENRPEPEVLITGEDLAERIGDIDTFMHRLMATIPEHAPVYEKECYIVNCSSSIPAFHDMHPDPFRALALRIHHEDTVYGWLILLSFNMDEIFRKGEYRLCQTIIEQVGLVISNSDLYRNLEDSVMNLVNTLVMAIEAKDVYTKGHSERVGQFSLRIAEEMQIGDKQMKDLRWASILHDIGKIGTPEQILNKPGKLTESEYMEIMEHPGRGADMLVPVVQLSGALPAIRHHHEKLDGTGYPDHLKGDAIPLLARIISVADTYDAIRSSRAYRLARSHTEAMTILAENSGTQLDGDIVAVFTHLMSQDT